MRQDLLKILDKSNSDNTILKDFVLKIKEVEECSNQYKSKPYHEWMQNGFAWQGFYSWLEDNLGDYIEVIGMLKEPNNNTVPIATNN